MKFVGRSDADLVSRITEFVGALSGHEGAELPESELSVALDASRLLSELRKTLGMPAPEAAEVRRSGRDDDSGGESDEDDDDSGRLSIGGDIRLDTLDIHTLNDIQEINAPPLLDNIEVLA
jgi:hypothetical protein